MYCSVPSSMGNGLSYEDSSKSHKRSFSFVTNSRGSHHAYPIRMAAKKANPQII